MTSEVSNTLDYFRLPEFPLHLSPAVTRLVNQFRGGRLVGVVRAVGLLRKGDVFFFRNDDNGQWLVSLWWRGSGKQAEDLQHCLGSGGDGWPVPPHSSVAGSTVVRQMPLCGRVQVV
ncbi:hypothetical protein E2C01_007767 [Portunus trituberculatus]|uniref:Uncharacterized protein n=1 Tax=Portunus trituberculatus TaxID=210409 RepID=A0A5B7CYZ4_PORTR|nr:hypothetical protein [Portunus trituberculatus]